MSKVTIYTKEGCPYCAAAIKHYTEQGVAFDEIDVFAEAGAKEKVLDITNGQRIVPVIVEGDDVKIGFGGG
ncbi:MAG: glutaredoxin family protein [candidate division Zixibacteria bacterium]|jgi:glutaredoxin 3|nr:glutaredoxin family protein [candidate division Zixibacteria bacterium]